MTIATTKPLLIVVSDELDLTKLCGQLMENISGQLPNLVVSGAKEQGTTSIRIIFWVELRHKRVANIFRYWVIRIVVTSN